MKEVFMHNDCVHGPFLFRADINRLNLYPKWNLYQFYDMHICVLIVNVYEVCSIRGFGILDLAHVQFLIQ